jgi:hypothetical protein
MVGNFGLGQMPESMAGTTGYTILGGGLRHHSGKRHLARCDYGKAWTPGPQIHSRSCSCLSLLSV